MFGCFFLGAATYFVYGLLRPKWAIAAGALWSFLAYDVVLAIPYLRLIGSDTKTSIYGPSNPVNMPSLIVYLFVIGASAAIALYAFFVHPPTRVIRTVARSHRVDEPRGRLARLR